MTGENEIETQCHGSLVTKHILEVGGKMKNGVGIRIKKMRKAQCLTMEALDSLVGVTKGYISQLESGKVGISNDTAYRIADVLHMEVSEIAEVSQIVRGGKGTFRHSHSCFAVCNFDSDEVAVCR